MSLRKSIFTFIFSFELSLCPYRHVTLVMCATVKPSSSALTPLTLSTRSLHLTGEAPHMDWKRDWKVLSQPCGDQGEGKRHTHAGTHTPACTNTNCRVLIHSSSPFTEDNLVFMTHISQWITAVPAICLRQPPWIRITSSGVRNPNDLLHVRLRPHVCFYLAALSSAGAESVQEPLHCQQRGHSGASTQWCRLTQVQDQHGQRQVGAWKERSAVEYQVFPC